MIIETGTKAEFKHCLIEQVWTWEFACGHVMVTDANYQEEYDRLIRDGFRCPRCCQPGSHTVFVDMRPCDR